MDDIATEAGLSKGALYLYYKSKDAIIAALLKFLFNQELVNLRAFVEAADKEAGQTTREQLLALTHRLAAAMKWMERLQPIAFEFYAIAGRRGEVNQYLKDYFREYRTLLSQMIQRGIERGEFRKVDPHATAITLAALYEGLALLFFVDPKVILWEEQAEAAVGLLLDGLEASH